MILFIIGVVVSLICVFWLFKVMSWNKGAISPANARNLDEHVKYIGAWLKDGVPPGHVLHTMPDGENFLTWGGGIGPNERGLVVDSNRIRYILNDSYMKGPVEGLSVKGEKKGIEEWHKERESSYPWEDKRECPCGEDECPLREKTEMEKWEERQEEHKKRYLESASFAECKAMPMHYSGAVMVNDNGIEVVDLSKQGWSNYCRDTTHEHIEEYKGGLPYTRQCVLEPRVPEFRYGRVDGDEYKEFRCYKKEHIRHHESWINSIFDNARPEFNESNHSLSANGVSVGVYTCHGDLTPGG